MRSDSAGPRSSSIIRSDARSSAAAIDCPLTARGQSTGRARGQGNFPPHVRECTASALRFHKCLETQGNSGDGCNRSGICRRAKMRGFWSQVHLCAVYLTDRQKTQRAAVRHDPACHVRSALAASRRSRTATEALAPSPSPCGARGKAQAQDAPTTVGSLAAGVSLISSLSILYLRIRRVVPSASAAFVWL